MQVISSNLSIKLIKTMYMFFLLILTCTDKTKVFQRKLQILKRKAIEGNFEMFPLVSNTCINETLPIIVEHLISLEENVLTRK